MLKQLSEAEHVWLPTAHSSISENTHREAKVRHPTAIKTQVRGSADEGSPALACSSVEGEGVAYGRTGTVKTSRGIGAAVGAHVTSGRQSALVNVWEGAERVQVSAI